MHDFFPPDRPREVRPGEYPAWDAALALVNRDLATLLPEHGPLRLLALPHRPTEPTDAGQPPEQVYVALPDGRWHGDDLHEHPDSTPDGTPAGALVDVAEAAQETVLECLWQVWPVCPDHRLGMHPGLDDGRPVWRCAGSRAPGNPEHVRAIGDLEPPYRPRGARRERNRNKQSKRDGTGASQ
ncbi:hypothetical protein JCM4814A_35470 [Streptomyces phaeofaciens JCM 4814]|uniref:Uncharacterized protein n=1 Tax=Streptomyces phaeofaciens TaxID=68254 RepID=A0A918HN88_9ACTN|nr:hypothetical protein [Streptomyces phaeofaciens]GGT84907.1 hypothetical protein GCM10010226_74450 [Streptomyces phaeofaciens]